MDYAEGLEVDLEEALDEITDLRAQQHIPDFLPTVGRLIRDRTVGVFSCGNKSDANILWNLAALQRTALLSVI